MKKFARDNIRSAKANNQQARINQSQSPPQNKVLKKIQHTHKEGTKKHEFSLQDNYLRPEQKEEAQDFRVEIERRYQRSVSNKEYAFPLRKLKTEESLSENDSSLGSLEHVTVCDLAAQNHKQKLIQKPAQNAKAFVSSAQILRTEPNEDVSDTFSEPNFTDDSDSEIPIEVRIRDKNSSTYRKLIRLLEMNPMFSHNSTNIYIPRTDTQESANVAKTQNEGIGGLEVGRTYTTQSYQNAKQDLLTNFTTQVSTIDTQKGFLNNNYLHNEKTKQADRNVKSSERRDKSVKRSPNPSKITKIESTSFLERNSAAAGAKAGKYLETEPCVQEGLKQFVNQNSSLNKSITPQYNPGKINMKEIFSREGPFKTYSNGKARPLSSSGKNQNLQATKKNPLDNLYQRAQKEVLSSKLTLTYGVNGANLANVKAQMAKNPKDGNQSNSNLSYSTIALKRDETPKDTQKPVTFANPTESTQKTLERNSTNSASSTKPKLSKKNSSRALDAASPIKKARDRTFYTSYDFSQEQFIKKPVSKLDLTKRVQGHGREPLSSSRNRDKTPEKSSIEASQNIFMRTSYDVNNNNQSSTLNTSSQKNYAKITAVQQVIKKQNSFTRHIQSAKIGSNK